MSAGTDYLSLHALRSSSLPSKTINRGGGWTLGNDEPHAPMAQTLLRQFGSDMGCTAICRKVLAAFGVGLDICWDVPPLPCRSDVGVAGDDPISDSDQLLYLGILGRYHKCLSNLPN